MTEAVDLALVILSYNSAGDLEACLRSVAAADNGPSEIVVVDNASRDSSVEIVRAVSESLSLTVKLFELGENLGCAGGNNVGWRGTSSNIVVFLNPDTEVDRGFFDALRKSFYCDDIGVVGARIRYPGSNVLQHAGGFVYPNGMTGHYGNGKTDSPDFHVERDVDYVTGAGFGIKRTLLNELGGFREEFFPAYFEEVDLCTRAWRARMRVVYNPAVTLMHKESVSLGVDSKRFRRLYQRMRIRYLLLNLRWHEWREAIGFEKWWWQQHCSKGHRAEQIRAYWEGLLWKLGLIK